MIDKIINKASCGQCNYIFILTSEQLLRCPNCRSKRWRDKKLDISNCICQKCGYVKDIDLLYCPSCKRADTNKNYYCSLTLRQYQEFKEFVSTYSGNDIIINGFKRVVLNDYNPISVTDSVSVTDSALSDIDIIDTDDTIVSLDKDISLENLKCVYFGSIPSTGDRQGWMNRRYKQITDFNDIIPDDISISLNDELLVIDMKLTGDMNNISDIEMDSYRKILMVEVDKITQSVQ